MQIENVIFLNAKFKNGRTVLNLHDDAKLLRLLGRKFRNNNSAQYESVAFLDYRKHYVDLLLSHLFINITNIDNTIIGSKKSASAEHDYGMLNNLNNKYFPGNLLYHYCMKNSSVHPSNSDYNEEIATDYIDGKYDEYVIRDKGHYIQIKLFEVLYENYGYFHTGWGTVNEMTISDNRAQAEFISRYHSLDKAFASYIINTFTKDELFEFTINDAASSLDSFIKNRLDGYIDFIFLLDNIHMHPEWYKLFIGNTPEFALRRAMKDFNTVYRNQLPVKDESALKDRPNYNPVTPKGVWGDDYESFNYVFNTNLIKTLVFINAPLTHNMAYKLPHLPNNISINIFKILEVDKSGNDTNPPINSMLKNDSVRNIPCSAIQPTYSSNYINYKENYLDYYPFDFIMQFTISGSTYAFDSYANKVGKLLDLHTYKSTLISPSFTNSHTSTSLPGIVTDNTFDELLDYQYRFYNKSINNFTNMNNLFEMHDKTNKYITSHYGEQYSLFQMEVNTSQFKNQLQDIIDNINEYKTRDIQLYLNLKLIQDNENNSEIKDLLAEIKKNLGYGLLLDIQNHTYHIDDIDLALKWCENNKLAFSIFYDLRFEHIDYLTLVNKILSNIPKCQIILNTNNIESFNLSYLLAKKIIRHSGYNKNNIHVSLYKNMHNIDFYSLFSDEVDY